MIDGQNIFAGSDGTIYLSLDYGDSWNPISNGLSDLKTVKAILKTDSKILVGTDGVYYTTDYGKNWEKTGLPEYIYTFIESQNKIYAGTAHGVYVSTDKGLNWKYCGLQDEIYALVIKEGIIIAAANEDNEMYKSVDGGETWIPVGFNDCCNMFDMTVCDNYIFAGTGNTIYRSANNGTTWDTLNNEINIHAFAVKDSRLFAGSSKGVYYSDNYGENWIAFNSNIDDVHIVSLGISDTYIYAGTWDLGIWKRSLSELTGIETINIKPEIKVFPNPATDKICIEFSSESTSKITYEICSVSGCLIKRNALDNNEINISDLKKGLYSIRLLNDEVTVIKKFIVQ